MSPPFIERCMNLFMSNIQEFKNHSLKEIFYNGTMGEPRYYLIVENLDDLKELSYWVNIKKKLPFREEYKDSGIIVDVGTKKDWENRLFKFGWEKVEF